MSITLGKQQEQHIFLNINICVYFWKSKMNVENTTASPISF